MNIIYRIISFLISTIFTIFTAVGTFHNDIPPKVSLDKMDTNNIIYSNDNFDFSYDKGKFSLSLNGVTMFADAVSQYKIENTLYSSDDYEVFSLNQEEITDERGSGHRITATAIKSGLFEMNQIFNFYQDEKYFTVSLSLSSDGDIVASNYIAPIVILGGKIQNGQPEYTHFLEVPFDNDSWATFETKNLCQSGLSHEIGAFFTPDAKDGLIIGSLTHDTWKSAVEYKNKLAKVEELYVYSGANTTLTRDQSPHGTVKGESVSSAVFFVGYYDNWKDGMTEYAKVNTTFTSKRASVTDSNPIGWNSWGSIQSDLSFSNAVATSDYIKENFQQTWQDEENIIYVNLDSYWDNMTDDELKAFVKHCEENGQVAGIYSSPFIVWWDEYGMENNYVPGTNISYNDIRLKKADGTYYGNDIDGCYPLDVTHPATFIHFKTQFERLMSCGFKYIKLDFLVHGSLEGDYYNDQIQTGIQAYNYAMDKVCQIIGDDIFINLSMSPIFPYHYANGRRICCDTYSGISETEYMLNSLTYGFWQSELYDFIDPDHIVLWGKNGDASENEANSRMISGIITGGSFLTGDNFVTPANNSEKAFARYNNLLGNEKLIEVLKLGKPFEAKLSPNCEYASDVFTLEDGDKTYIAVLNYSSLPKVVKIDLPYENSTVENLLTGEIQTKNKDQMTIFLESKDSMMFEITNKNYEVH